MPVRAEGRLAEVEDREREAGEGMSAANVCECKGWRGWFRVGPYLFCDRCRKAKP